jgi:uncharacterized protein (TIGR01244 family)
MLRQLDEKTLVSGQISIDQLPELKARGIAMIVNNRVDDEDPGQPRGAEIEEAARAAGLEYRHVPIRRGPGPAEVEAMRDALASCAQGQVLAYCRSGYRSALAWALAQSEEGRPREEIEAAAGAAGIDLSPVAHLL